MNYMIMRLYINYKEKGKLHNLCQPNNFQHDKKKYKSDFELNKNHLSKLDIL